jgi:hypothetical protein
VSASGEPRRPRLDAALRWVWLINGIILLLALVGSGIFVAAGAIANMGSAEPPSATHAPSPSVDARRPVRYDAPDPVRGGTAEIVLIRRQGQGYAYTEPPPGTGVRRVGPGINVAFIGASGTRLLLDTPAYIREVAYPSAAKADSAQPLRWIVYEMARVDTDHDGKVDEHDRRSLFLSSLDGSGLREVLPAGEELREWQLRRDGSLVVTSVVVKEGARPAEMAERSYLVDAQGNVHPLAQLDSAAAQAGRIMDR